MFFFISLLRCKERHYVNGMTGKVQYVEGNIFIQASEKITPVFAAYDQGQEYFPIVAGCAPTVHKVIRTIANCALDRGLNVCLLTPTGKLCPSNNNN